MLPSVESLMRFRPRIIELLLPAACLMFAVVTAQPKKGELVERFLSVKAQVDQRGQKGKASLSAEGSELFDSLFPLAKLKLDQAMLHLDDDRAYPTRSMKRVLAEMAGGSMFRTFPSDSGTAKAKELLDEVVLLLKALQEGKNVLPENTGKLVERAYIARNDGSAQPYYIYLPKIYDPEKKYPLFIFLHGWVPETSKIDPWICSPSFGVYEMADEMGFMYLQPHGRRNTDFQFVGETDVLRSIRETQRYYRVDENRIYLIGASMGGAGVWHLAIHQPHEFAAISAINGQIDWFSFWEDMFRYPPRGRLPKYQQWMMAMNNPADLVGSLRALPTFLQHSVRDHINDVKHARRVYEKMKGLDCPVEAYWDPGGHFIYWEPPVYRRAFEKLLNYRYDEAPKAVRHVTYTLRFPTAHWVTIDRMAEWGPLASILAEFKEGKIEVKTENIAAYHLAVPQKLVPDGGDLKVISDGKEIFAGELPADRVIRFGSAGQDRLAKSTVVCGPVPDAFNFPFTVVKGTAGNEAQTRDLASKAERFLTEWWAYAEGLPPCKADRDVTDEDLKGRNLILFGRPSTNSLLARIANRLPIEIGDDSYRIGKRKFSGENLGLALVYPNPLNPKKYVVVFSGYFWGEKRGSNHKYDFIPDFIVYDDTFDPQVGTNHARCAGFFDIYWQLADELTWYD